MRYRARIKGAGVNDDGRIQPVPGAQKGRRFIFDGSGRRSAPFSFRVHAHSVSSMQCCHSISAQPAHPVSLWHQNSIIITDIAGNNICSFSCPGKGRFVEKLYRARLLRNGKRNNYLQRAACLLLRRPGTGVSNNFTFSAGAADPPQPPAGMRIGSNPMIS